MDDRGKFGSLVGNTNSEHLDSTNGHHFRDAVKMVITMGKCVSCWKIATHEPHGHMDNFIKTETCQEQDCHSDEIKCRLTADDHEYKMGNVQLNMLVHKCFNAWKDSVQHEFKHANADVDTTKPQTVSYTNSHEHDDNGEEINTFAQVVTCIILMKKYFSCWRNAACDKIVQADFGDKVMSSEDTQIHRLETVPTQSTQVIANDVHGGLEELDIPPPIISIQTYEANMANTVTLHMDRHHVDERIRLQYENDIMKRQLRCSVCNDLEVCIVFLPCGHLSTCTMCATTITQCNKCNDDIRRCMKINQE